MHISKLLIPLILLVFAASGASVVSAQSDWKKLGDENVNFQVDHDVIDVSDANRIRELRLNISGGPVKFRRVVINYKGGTKQEVDFIEEVPVGAFSRTFMIEGDGQMIDAVEFWYETAGFAGKKADITLFGRSYTGMVPTAVVAQPVTPAVVAAPSTTVVTQSVTPATDPSTTVVTRSVTTTTVADPSTAVVAAPVSAAVMTQGDWKRLGDKDVSTKLDHDTIDTNEKGKVRELRLSVLKAPVKFSRIVINYEDGEKKEMEFVESIAVDAFSPTIAIEGDGHAIKSVDVWYETASFGGKQAKVVVYGR